MIKRYLNKDFSELNSWYEKREIYGVKKETLSRLGFMVPKVAAGFLYKTDGDFCFLEGFISNPDASATDRGIAITEITEKLIESAKVLNYSKVIAITKDDSIRNRALAEGFKSLGDHEVLILGDI